MSIDEMDSPVDCLNELSDEELSECLNGVFDGPSEQENLASVSSQPGLLFGKNTMKPSSRSNSIDSVDSSKGACSVSSACSDSSYSSSDISETTKGNTSTAGGKKKRQGMDKATARKLANRESAKNSYLKKKEYVKNLEDENASLRAEVRRLREEGERMRKAMVAMQERQLLLEDHPIDIVGGGGVLPLYHNSTESAATPPVDATSAKRKRRRRGVTQEFNEVDNSTSAAPSSSVVFKSLAREGNSGSEGGKSSSGSIVKLATLPIVTISSTLCYVDNTSQLEPSRFGGSTLSKIGGDIIGVNVLVLIGVVAVVSMYFFLDFEKISSSRRKIGVKSRPFGKYSLLFSKGSGAAGLLPFKSGEARRSK